MVAANQTDGYWAWLKSMNSGFSNVGINGFALVAATSAFGLGAGFRLILIAADLFGGLTLPKLAFAFPSLVLGGLFFVVGGYAFYRLHWLLAVPLGAAIAWFFGSMFAADVTALW